MIVTLSLNLYLQDEPAASLNMFVLLNILVVQFFKRFFDRKRPGNCQPPRAFNYLPNQTSSFPSRIVVSATTFTFAILACGGTWVGNCAVMNDISIGWAIGVSVSMYLLTSFLQVNIGSVYPTDCLASLIPITIIIGLHYLIMFFEKISDVCPICDKNFCYYEGGESSPCTTLITRQSFDLWSLNLGTNVALVVVSWIVFLVLSYPVEYWNKMAYFFPTILALWLFQNMLLCPNQANGFQGIYTPELSLLVGHNADQACLIVAFFIFTLGTIWVVSNLLGKRTGNVLAFILRSIFFAIIMFWTLHCLLTVRMIMVDNVS